MKTYIENLFLLPALIACVGMIPAGRVTAQTFTTLHSFTQGTDDPYINSDGVYPRAGCILSSNTLFGATVWGGPSGCGTIFKLNTDGTGFTILMDGSSGGLTLSGNTLYGAYGINGTSGTVFAINTDGTGFHILHSYQGRDGVYPSSRLILSDNTLYGTSYGGGITHGSVFAVHTDGTGFTDLHSFAGSPSEGARPFADLVLSGNTLYGTTEQGGSSGNGTVFKVNIDGTGFASVYSFTATHHGNSDGANAEAGLILSGNTLYGTTIGGGSSGNGTVFAVNTDGTGFTNLHSFAGSLSEGALPFADLVLSGNTLYGTAASGGSSGSGTVFSLSFAPQLTIKASDANVVLTWPTNVAGFDYAGFTLQSTTNLVSPAVWSTVSPGPVVFNGQNAVTIPISDPRKFYRLSQ